MNQHARTKPAPLDAAVRVSFYIVFWGACGLLGTAISDDAWVLALTALMLALMTHVALYWRFHDSENT